MIKVYKLKYAILIICAASLFNPLSQAMAQEGQYKVRLSAEYHKYMLNESFIDVNVKFRGDDGYEPAVDLTLNVYYQLPEDSIILIREIITNSEGQARFQVDNNQLAIDDSSLIHEYVIKLEDSEKFKDAKKAVSFSD